LLWKSAKPKAEKKQVLIKAIVDAYVISKAEELLLTCF
jgi:hypothetical protein